MKKKNGCKIVGLCFSEGNFENCLFYIKDSANKYVCQYHDFDGANNICNCPEAILDEAEKK